MSVLFVNVLYKLLKTGPINKFHCRGKIYGKSQTFKSRPTVTLGCDDCFLLSLQFAHGRNEEKKLFARERLLMLPLQALSYQLWGYCSAKTTVCKSALTSNISVNRCTVHGQQKIKEQSFIPDLTIGVPVSEA